MGSAPALTANFASRGCSLKSRGGSGPDRLAADSVLHWGGGGGDHGRSIP